MELEYSYYRPGRDRCLSNVGGRQGSNYCSMKLLNITQPRHITPQECCGPVSTPFKNGTTVGQRVHRSAVGLLATSPPGPTSLFPLLNIAQSSRPPSIYTRSRVNTRFPKMEVKTVEFKPFTDQKPGTYVTGFPTPPPQLLASKLLEEAAAHAQWPRHRRGLRREMLNIHITP